MFHELLHTLQMPKCEVNVFISSSSFDCKLEREIMFNYILPRLRVEHLDDNIDISLSDMRWGIVDSRSNLHLSWTDCADEIKRCHDRSQGRLFFISLQADKYGHSVLPHSLPKEVFERCVKNNSHMYENRLVVTGKSAACVDDPTDENIQEMLKSLKNQDANRKLADIAQLWYSMDEKSESTDYRLRELTEDSMAEWLVDKACLLKFFENVACYQDLATSSDDEALLINRSVSEFEIKYAYSLSRGEGRLSTPLWMLRQFSHDSHHPYSYDKSTTMKIENLKAWMIGELAARGSSAEGMCALSVKFDEYVKGAGPSYDRYIESWTRRVHEELSRTVTQCLQSCSEWWGRHCELLGLTREQLEEICWHYQFAREQCDMFVGRDDGLSVAVKEIVEWRRGPEDVTSQSCLAGVCLSVVGGSGTGKSCFMAALAEKLRELEKDKATKGLPSSPVIARFIGVSKESTNGFNLVMSICVEIQGCLGIADRLPVDYAGITSRFLALMKEHSVVLVIDALDCLTHEHQAGGNMLSVLAGIDPHDTGRVIVSTRHDEEERGRPGVWKVCYGCDSRLQESKVFTLKMKPFRDKTCEFSVDPKSEVVLLARSYLRVHGRGVTIEQKKIDNLLKRLAVDKPPTPLSVILAARLLVENCRSSNFTVETTDEKLLAQTFKLLEKQYGKRLTLMAFSFITFSVNGVSDIELMDLLSLDNELTASVYEYRSCSKHRVAVHLWQRLKKAAGVLLRTNKQGLLEWTHRKVRSFAVRMYSEQKFTKKYVHGLLGQYFANIVEKRVREDRAIGAQPITLNTAPVWFHNTHINRRRFEEGLFHLIEANLFSEACDEVCNLDNICAFFKSGLKTQLATHIIKLHRAIVDTGKSKRTVFSFSDTFFNKVDCYMRWIRQMNCEINSFSPETGIFATCSATQPVYSVVREEMFKLFDVEYSKKSNNNKVNYIANWPSIVTELTHFSTTSWNRGICFGENIQFQSIISTFVHSQPVKCIDWIDSATDTRIVSATDKSMAIWDTITKEVVDSFELLSDIFCLAVSKDSLHLACGTKDRLIRIFDLASGKLHLSLSGHAGFVTCLTFSSCNNSQLCSGSTDCSVRLWSTTMGGTVLRSFEGHSFEVTHVMFSPDDKRIVSGSLDKTVKMWEVSTGDLMYSLDELCSYVHSVAFDSSGEKVAVASGDGMAYIVSAWSDEVLQALKGHEGAVTSVAFSPDGELLASGSLDRSLKIWHVVSGIMVASFSSHTDGINDVKFSFDSQKVVTASRDSTVRMFDVATELLTPVESTFDSNFESRKKCVNSVCFSPDGSKLVSTSGREVSVWDVLTRRRLKTLTDHSHTTLSASYNTNNSKICSCAADGSVLVWDAMTFEVIARLRASGSVTSVAFTLDGYKIVLRTSDYRVSFWDYFSGAIVHEFSNPRQIYRHDPYQMNSVTFCPEGLLKTISVVNARMVINGIEMDDESRLEVQLWDVVANEMISTLDPYPPLAPLHIRGGTVLSRSFTLSPDGLSVAVGYTDGAIVVSFAMSGRSVMTLTGHAGAVTSICFNIEGTRLVSGSADCSIRVWDVHAGMLVATLRGHRAAVVHVTFSPCGLKVASGSEDKTLMLWDAVELKQRGEGQGVALADVDVDAQMTVPGIIEKNTAFVSQMAALIGHVTTEVDPDDAFLTEDERRIKSYKFQYVDGW